MNNHRRMTSDLIGSELLSEPESCRLFHKWILSDPAKTSDGLALFLALRDFQHFVRIRNPNVGRIACQIHRRFIRNGPHLRTGVCSFLNEDSRMEMSHRIHCLSVGYRITESLFNPVLSSLHDHLIEYYAEFERSMEFMHSKLDHPSQSTDAPCDDLDHDRTSDGFSSLDSSRDNSRAPPVPAHKNRMPTDNRRGQHYEDRPKEQTEIISRQHIEKPSANKSRPASFLDASLINHELPGDRSEFVRIVAQELQNLEFAGEGANTKHAEESAVPKPNPYSDSLTSNVEEESPNSHTEDIPHEFPLYNSFYADAECAPEEEDFSLQKVESEGSMQANSDDKSTQQDLGDTFGDAYPEEEKPDVHETEAASSSDKSKSAKPEFDGEKKHVSDIIAEFTKLAIVKESKRTDSKPRWRTENEDNTINKRQSLAVQRHEPDHAKMFNLHDRHNAVNFRSCDVREPRMTTSYYANERPHTIHREMAGVRLSDSSSGLGSGESAASDAYYRGGRQRYKACTLQRRQPEEPRDMSYRHSSTMPRKPSSSTTMRVSLREMGRAPLVAHVPHHVLLTRRQFRRLFGISDSADVRLLFKSDCEDRTAPYQWNLMVDDDELVPIHKGSITGQVRRMRADID